MCNNCDEDRSCIGEILKVILVLQENASPESTFDSCDRPMLGGGPNCLICNTRPVMLYTCCGNGVAWVSKISETNYIAHIDTKWQKPFFYGVCFTIRVF